MVTRKGNSELFQALISLGVEPTMETFPDRKRIQKLVYLLKQVGINFGFKFNWHIHGPYSPKLTSRMFDVLERGHKLSFDKPLLKSMEIKIWKLRKLLGVDIYSVDKLELLTSLAFIEEKYKKEAGYSPQTVIDVLRKSKPKFSKSQIDKSMKKLAVIQTIRG